MGFLFFFLEVACGRRKLGFWNKILIFCIKWKVKGWNVFFLWLTYICIFIWTTLAAKLPRRVSWNFGKKMVIIDYYSFFLIFWWNSVWIWYSHKSLDSTHLACTFYGGVPYWVLCRCSWTFMLMNAGKHRIMENFKYCTYVTMPF